MDGFGSISLAGRPAEDDKPSKLAQLLRSVARGAPQAVTGLVDLAALPLTATNVLRPDQVFGSTDYLTKRGLLPQPEKGLANQTAEVLAGGLMPLSPTAIRQTVAGVKSLAPKAMEMGEDYLRGLGGLADVVPVGPNKVPSNEILFPNRSLSSLTSPEKSALTRFDKEIMNDAAMRREVMRLEGGGTVSKRVTPLVEKKLYTPEDLYKKQLMFFGGDQMSAGKQFNTINGVPLSKPVVSQGGDEYTFLQPNFDNNIGWASNIGPSTGHMLNVNKAYDASNGREVLALKNSMNPNGADFSHPMAQALVRQLGAIKPNSKEVEVINQMVRSHKNADDVVGDYKNFAGFLSPNAEEQILKGIAGESSAGDLRKVMLKVARSAEARKVGFPIYEDMLDAMLIPEHRNMMTGQGGNVIFTPKYQDKLIATPQYEHGSYTHGIPRDPDGIVGGLEQTVPTRILAHKTFAGHLAKGRSPNAAASSMQKGQWSEEFDQESLDKAMAYLKERKRLLEQE